MLRAAAWTVGLFAVGAAVVNWLPAGAWVEPVVLAALGAALLLAGGRRSAAGTTARAGGSEAPAGVAAAGRAAH